jgi:hypothetical protein
MHLLRLCLFGFSKEKSMFLSQVFELPRLGVTMLCQFRKNKDESGIVLIFVLVVVMIMAISSASIFTQSISQDSRGRDQLDKIVGEELAKGIFWSTYNTTVFGGVPNPPQNLTYTLNGRTYTTADATVTGTAPNYNLSVAVTCANCGTW